MRNSAVSIAILTCTVIAAVLIAAVVIVHETTGTPVAALVRDPAATLEMPAYLGLLSHATVIIWSAAATICLFAATLLPAGHPAREFLALAGAITLVVALDDAYMFHEIIAPELFGIPEKVVYLLYAIAAVTLLVRGRQLIMQTNYSLLILALTGLSLSVGIDVLDSRGWFPIEDPYLLEDGCKIAGALFWLAYFSLLAGTLLRK